jgi:hypothetical protein
MLLLTVHHVIPHFLKLFSSQWLRQCIYDILRTCDQCVRDNAGSDCMSDKVISCFQPLLCFRKVILFHDRIRVITVSVDSDRYALFLTDTYLHHDLVKPHGFPNCTI